MDQAMAHLDKALLRRISAKLAATLDGMDLKPTLEEFRRMLAAYLDAQQNPPPPSRDEPDAFKRAMKQGAPIQIGGDIHVSTRELLPFLRRRWENLSRLTLARLLRRLGARERTIYARRGEDGELLGRRYWRLPPNIRPAEGEGRAAPPDFSGLEATLRETSLLEFLEGLEYDVD